MAERPPAISLRGVRKEFPGGVVAVHGLDLDIADGEFVTLLGPSGSGKTTVLRMIAGFERPTAGTVSLRGHDVTTAPPFERDVHTVFQDYALFPHLSVLRNVEYPLRIAKVGRVKRRERAMEALATVRLEGMADRVARGALGRSAAARRAGPRAGRTARRAPARRAARRTRPEAARADAGRAAADPAGRRHHVRARHPRPGRGTHARRPDRRVRRRARRAGGAGRGRCTSGPRRRSSLVSSARRTCCLPTPRWPCSAGTGRGACAPRRSASPAPPTSRRPIRRPPSASSTRSSTPARRPAAWSRWRHRTSTTAARLTVLLVNDGHGRRAPERGETVRLFWRPEHEVPVA